MELEYLLSVNPIIADTTILSEVHYDTFREDLIASNWDGFSIMTHIYVDQSTKYHFTLPGHAVSDRTS